MVHSFQPFTWLIEFCEFTREFFFSSSLVMFKSLSLALYTKPTCEYTPKPALAPSFKWTLDELKCNWFHNYTHIFQCWIKKKPHTFTSLYLHINWMIFVNAFAWNDFNEYEFNGYLMNGCGWNRSVGGGTSSWRSHCLLYAEADVYQRYLPIDACWASNICRKFKWPGKQKWELSVMGARLSRSSPHLSLACVFKKVGLPTLPFVHRSYARLNISWCLSQHKIMCGVRSSTITCSCKRTHGTPTKVTRVLTKASRWFLKLN